MNPIGYLEFSEVLIEDEPYQVFSVRRLSTRRNNTNINAQYRYRVVPITGTSMNAARPVPIREDDYVLMQEQAQPDDNDIVVAEIVGVDNRATVKRFKRTNGKIQLLPESTDPKHDPIDLEREFNVLDDDLKVRGVVIAIFKKKPC